MDLAMGQNCPYPFSGIGLLYVVGYSIKCSTSLQYLQYLQNLFCHTIGTVSNRNANAYREVAMNILIEDGTYLIRFFGLLELANDGYYLVSGLI